MQDPNEQSAWTRPPLEILFGGELGDNCEATFITEGTFVYQRIWSNLAAAKGGDPCVPHRSQDAYINVSVPQTWYKISPGESVPIPITGFSDRATSDWVVELPAPYGAFTASVAGASASNQITMNNGQQATLTLQAGTNAASGDWAIMQLISRVSAPGGDPFERWLVGMYVP
jgi:hypothetical protein